MNNYNNKQSAVPFLKYKYFDDRCRVKVNHLGGSCINKTQEKNEKIVMQYEKYEE